MAWQRSGGLAKGLRDHGVRSIVVGDLTEEWYLYSIAHPIPTTSDIVPNLRRYLPADVVEKLVKRWRKIPDDASSDETNQYIPAYLACS